MCVCELSWNFSLNSPFNEKKINGWGLQFVKSFEKIALAAFISGGLYCLSTLKKDLVG